jgi:hypothetical protein
MRSKMSGPTQQNTLPAESDVEGPQAGGKLAHPPSMGTNNARRESEEGGGSVVSDSWDYMEGVPPWQPGES